MSANTNLPALSLETPIASSWYSSTVPNQINTWTYDAAGNVMQVGGMNRTFAYDAENRQVSATINSATAIYSYDGNGLRVGKTSGSNTTVYVYDAFGSLDAEYSSRLSDRLPGVADRSGAGTGGVPVGEPWERPGAGEPASDGVRAEGHGSAIASHWFCIDLHCSFIPPLLLSWSEWRGT